MRDYYVWTPQFHRQVLLKPDHVRYAISQRLHKMIEQVLRKVYLFSPQS
jgi:hypothetical protein